MQIIQETKKSLAANVERIGTRVVIVGMSGGKDSTALALLLEELEIPFRGVFMDTGWEHRDTIDYVRDVLAERFDIVTIGRPGGMSQLCIEKGAFPGRTRRFCTEELKMKPLKAYLDSLDTEPVSAVGVRAQESDIRATYTEWEYSKGLDCDVWRPLLRWTYDDVIKMHQRHAFKPNPLYLRGAERVGCFPCVMARKAEVRALGNDPIHLHRVRQLESDVQSAAAERHAAKGEVTKTPPAFFQAPIRDKDGIRPCTPIDDVVRWSRTKHGGKVLDSEWLASVDTSCTRWGFCDAVETPDP